METPLGRSSSEMSAGERVWVVKLGGRVRER